MLNLILAICSSALIAVIMRLSSHRAKAGKTMLAANYLICLLLAAVYSGFQRLFPNTDTLPTALGLGSLNGALYLGGFVLMQQNVKKNGVVLSSIFTKLGLLVPILLSVFLFGEVPTWLQVPGFVVAIAAIVLINLQKGSKSTTSVGSLLLLLLVTGSADAMSKIFEEVGDPALSDPFLFYTFAVAFLLCVVLVIVSKEKPDLTSVLFGIVIGIPNFFSAKFLLRSLADLPAVVVYPSFSIATMLLTTLIGVFFFKERLVKRQWLALAGIIAALFLLNI